MRNYFILGLALTALAAPAQAQEMKSLGLSYTTKGASKEAAPSPMHYRKIYRGDEKNTVEEVHAQELKERKEEAAADRVWKKYKALAAGTYDEKEARAELEKQEKALEAPQSAENNKAAAPPVEGSGIAALIEEYRKNKEQRSQLRTLTVSEPGKKEK